MNLSLIKTRKRAEAPRIAQSVVYREHDACVEAQLERLRRQRRQDFLSLSPAFLRYYQRRELRAAGGRVATCGIFLLCAAVALGLVWVIWVLWVWLALSLYIAHRRSPRTLRERLVLLLRETPDRLSDLARVSRPLEVSLLEFASVSSRLTLDLASLVLFGVLSAAVLFVAVPGFPVLLFVGSYFLSVLFFRLPGVSGEAPGALLLLRQLRWLLGVLLLPGCVLGLISLGASSFCGLASSLVVGVVLFHWLTRQASEEEWMMCQLESV